MSDAPTDLLGNIDAEPSTTRELLGRLAYRANRATEPGELAELTDVTLERLHHMVPTIDVRGERDRLRQRVAELEEAHRLNTRDWDRRESELRQSLERIGRERDELRREYAELQTEYNAAREQWAQKRKVQRWFADRPVGGPEDAEGNPRVWEAGWYSTGGRIEHERRRTAPARRASTSPDLATWPPAPRARNPRAPGGRTARREAHPQPARLSVLYLPQRPDGSQPFALVLSGAPEAYTSAQDEEFDRLVREQTGAAAYLEYPFHVDVD